MRLRKARSHDETCGRPDGEEDWPGVTQNEPFIAISPNLGGVGEPTPLQFAVWRDFTLHPRAQQTGLGFAMSSTDLSDWKGCDDCCDTGGLRAGHSISRADWPKVTDGGCLPDTFLYNDESENPYVGNTDPSVAIGGPSPWRVHIGGLLQGGTDSVMYARSLDSGETWEIAELPGVDCKENDDCIRTEQPKIFTDRRPLDAGAPAAGTAVHIVWSEYYSSGTIGWGVRLSSSPSGGDEFLASPFAVPVMLSPPPGAQTPSKLGAMGAVGPEGEIHAIWTELGDPNDTIRFRSTWDNGSTLVPSSAPGTVRSYDTLRGGDVFESTNLDFDFTPSMAADDDSDECGYGGKVYVAYAEEEDLGTDTTDSNIYLVRSLAIDQTNGILWSDRVTVNILSESATECEDGENTFYRYPIQFAPQVAVDDEGHVGVMWYDATADPDPCDFDGNTVFNVYFAVSNDGGRTFGNPVCVTTTPSETEPDSNINIGNLDLREYVGISARDDLFQLAWTDLRNWNGNREEGYQNEGDIFTAQVTASGFVYLMGDGDFDTDVDTTDLTALNTCVTMNPYDPVACESFDFDMDGDVDKDDICTFYDCATAPLGEFPEFCRESSSSSSHSGGECHSSHIESCLALFDLELRTAYAAALIELASVPGEPDASAMVIIAEGILGE